MTKKQVIAVLQDAVVCIKEYDSPDQDHIDGLNAAIDMLENAVVFTRCSKQMPTKEDGDRAGSVNIRWPDGSFDRRTVRHVNEVGVSCGWSWSRIERPTE